MISDVGCLSVGSQEEKRVGLEEGGRLAVKMGFLLTAEF